MAVLLVTVASASAHAQIESREGIALENEIYELRHELDALRAQGGGGGGAEYAPAPSPQAGQQPGLSSDLATQLLDRVTRLEDDVRRLRGRIDEVDNARQQADADLAKQIGDLQFRLGQGGLAQGGLAQGGGGLAGGAASLTPPGQPAAGQLGRPSLAPASPLAGLAPAHRTPEVALQAGSLALAHHDYATAEQDARDVLAGTKGPRTTEALFLLAQALNGQHNYQAAAVAYDDTYNRASRGYHAPDSLLGLANSLNALGDKRAACETLGKLRAEFPSPRADLREQIAAARSRASCH